MFVGSTKALKSIMMSSNWILYVEGQSQPCGETRGAEEGGEQVDDLRKLPQGSKGPEKSLPREAHSKIGALGKLYSEQ
jgi:hypothetical protein